MIKNDKKKNKKIKHVRISEEKTHPTKKVYPI